MKKELLSRSHLELNEYFNDKRSWRREDIEQRAAVWPYFGDENAEEHDNKKATGTTPAKVSILGQYFIVHSWRDVLERTMNTIAELEPEKFEQIMQQYPRFVGRDKKKFKALRELKNGTFIEVNLSALEIQRFCFQALETIELSAEDLQVEAG
jgi:phage terminase large subunit-like protein